VLPGVEWLVVAGVIAIILIAVLTRAVRKPVKCPREVGDVERALSAMFDDVRTVKFGDYVAFRARSGYIPLAVVVNCKKGEVSTEWPWPLALVLFLAPNLQIPAVVLFIWFWDAARRFRNTVLHLLSEAAAAE